VARNGQHVALRGQAGHTDSVYADAFAIQNWPRAHAGQFALGHWVVVQTYFLTARTQTVIFASVCVGPPSMASTALLLALDSGADFDI
jgi:hypothetical protein